MNKITITKTALNVKITGYDKLWSFKGTMEIPLDNINSIALFDGIEKPPFWRCPGTYIPGIIISGTYYGKNRKEFWNTRYNPGAIVIKMKNSDYTKIVLDCDNSEAILSKLGMA